MLNMRQAVINSGAAKGKQGFPEYRRIMEPQPAEPVAAFPLDYADALPCVWREKSLWERIKKVFCG